MEFLKKKHELRMEVGLVQDHDLYFPTVPQPGDRIIKKWCPNCETGFEPEFPIKCVCGGLVHVECHSLYDDYEYRIECDKCKCTWTFDPWIDIVKIELGKFEMYVRKTILLRFIDAAQIEDRIKKKIKEHLEKIYYNAPKINYSGFK